MSKIGEKIINVPANVEVTIEKGGKYGNQVITVKGPNGTSSIDIRKGITVEKNDAVITLKRSNETPAVKSYHGLYRSLINNYILGAVELFQKKLEIHGVGYRAVQKGNAIELALGFSHKITFTPIEGVKVNMVDENTILITGHDKQTVGQTASDIRALRKPEPYKGKGVRYFEEKVKRKAGKAAASAK